MFLALLILSTACTFKKGGVKNQISEGHEELYAEPDSPKTFSHGNIERIVIASTNDLHGMLNPTSIDYGIKLGGADILSQYFKILRANYGDIVLVDSGDFIPGETDNLKTVHDFYETMNYDAVTVGLNDFNLKLPKNLNSSTDLFKEFTKTSTPPLVLSNLFQLKTARTVEWEGAKPYVMKEIRGVKIGIIGLVASDIVNKTPVQNRTGLFVEEMTQSTLRHARLLRSLGADLIVVITHQGIECGEAMAELLKLPVNKVNFDPHDKKACNFDSEMGLFLERLPPHLVDVVIGGRVPHKMANFVNDTLVLSGFEAGKSLNYVEFFIDKEAHKVIKEKTVVHQPVMTCHEFFKETNDCFTEDKSVNHDKKIPAKFLGTEIVPDVESQKIQAHLQVERNFLEVMKASGADLVYAPASTGDSQLMVIEISGLELLKVLEEDFNQDNTAHWIPTLFEEKSDGLHLTIKGEKISYDKNYKILGDLESLQNQPILMKKITLSEKSLIHLSWNHSEMASDEIQSTLAAPTLPVP